MKPQNLLILFSDEHNPRVQGAAGHPFISTPHLDALAARGTRFAQASTPCPICVPARASLATGRYGHEIGYWDNADAYEGSVPSWHHVLRERGHRVVSIGKLHFRGHKGDDHGFSEERLAMHINEGLGDLLALNRGADAQPRGGAKKLIAMAGPGESDYTRYDRDIAAQAQIWLREEAPKYTDRPWVLFVSLVAPHFPLTAPPEHYYRYANMRLPMPKQYAREERPQHPHLAEYARVVPYDAAMKGEAEVRRAKELNDARSYENQTISKARAEAESRKNLGDAERTRLVEFVAAEVERFTNNLPAWRSNRELFAQQRQSEALRIIYTNVQEKVVAPDSGGGAGRELRLQINREPPKPKVLEQPKADEH